MSKHHGNKGPRANSLRKKPTKEDIARANLAAKQRPFANLRRWRMEQEATKEPEGAEAQDAQS